MTDRVPDWIPVEDWSRYNEQRGCTKLLDCRRGFLCTYIVTGFGPPIQLPASPPRYSNRLRSPAGPIPHRLRPPPLPLGRGRLSHPSVDRIFPLAAACTRSPEIPAGFLCLSFGTPDPLPPQPFRRSHSRPFRSFPRHSPQRTPTPSGASLPEHLLETLGVGLAGASGRCQRGDGVEEFHGKACRSVASIVSLFPQGRKGDRGAFAPHCLGPGAGG